MIETELEKSLSDTAESKEHRLALYNEHLRSVYAKNSISRAVASRHNRKQKKGYTVFHSVSLFLIPLMRGGFYFGSFLAVPDVGSVRSPRGGGSPIFISVHARFGTGGSGTAGVAGARPSLFFFDISITSRIVCRKGGRFILQQDRKNARCRRFLPFSKQYYTKAPAFRATRQEP